MASLTKISLSDYLVSGFMSTIQVFPDSILLATLLFSIILQSPQFSALGLALLSVSFFHPLLGMFFRQIVPESLRVSEYSGRESGRYPGLSYERAQLGLFGSLTDSEWPSYYSMFIGTLAGYIGFIPTFYEKELNASKVRSQSVYYGIGFLAILCVFLLMYRYISGIESLLSIIAGSLSGLVLGSSLMAIISVITQRRGINLLNFPLIGDSITAKKPIYVCG